MPDEGIGISAHTGTSSTAAKAVETYSGSTPYVKFYCAGIEKLFFGLSRREGKSSALPHRYTVFSQIWSMSQLQHRVELSNVRIFGAALIDIRPN